ncbi:MAG: RNA polymerase subunit sigma-70 [Planctomycetes bacterium]|nr:RNA polymerase subunit sigma-70 [Planctomycetota bacterium]
MTPADDQDQGATHGATPYLAVAAELHAIAARLLRGERSDHTLQPTALMHEAWLRLAKIHAPWADHGHFVRAAAGTMRRVLVEHARARARDKRGGEFERVTLSPDVLDLRGRPEELVVVDDVMRALAQADPELERLVELRVFGGLTHAEIATATGRSLRSVERDWRLARAFLQRALESGDGP